ncbi:putative peptidase M8, leishmanolysin [Helianthus debilis subsp. tardiflorus]
MYGIHYFYGPRDYLLILFIYWYVEVTRGVVYGLIISTNRLCSRFYDGCYQQKYVNNMLEVVVDGIWKVCSVACGPIQFPAFNGDLICTLYHELYSGVDHILTFEYCPNSCNSNGDCVGGIYHCFLGFNGHGCRKLKYRFSNVYRLVN